MSGPTGRVTALAGRDRERLLPEHMRVTWLAALFALCVGATMTYLPYAFQGQAFQRIYPSIRLIGMLFGLSGVLMGLCALYPRAPRVVDLAGRAVFLGAMSGYWWTVNVVPGGTTGAVLYPIMMLAVLFEALPWSRDRPTLRWFFIAIGLPFGAALVIDPALFPNEIFGRLSTISRVTGLLLVGCAVALAIGRGAPWRRIVYLALVAPFVILAWMLGTTHAWSGMELHMVLALGAIVAATAPRVRGAHGVRWRLLRGIAVAGLLPLALLGGLATYLAQRAIEADLSERVIEAAAAEAKILGEGSMTWTPLASWTRVRLILVNGDGTVARDSAPERPGFPPQVLAMARLVPDSFEIMNDAGERVLVAGRPVPESSRGVVAVLPLSEELEPVTSLGAAILAAFALAALLALVITHFVARDLVRRISAVLAAATELAEGAAPRRASDPQEPQPDEIDQLARGFDRMADRIREKEERLGKALDALKDADRRKDEFIAMLAHELRNPLAALKMSLELLPRSIAHPTGPSSEAARMQEIASRQVTTLARLVDDLLDVSRITGGQVELRREPVDVVVVLSRALETMRPQIDARGHRVDTSIEPGESFVDADPTRLEQVIVNLLSNAAKYTPPGGRVTVGLSRDRGRQAVQVTVTDTGRGISPELLPRIFDLFVQGERSLDRREGGLGIGLTLAKRLVELHGGRLSACSEGVGRGATFSLELPLLDAKTSAAAAGRAKRRATAPSPAGSRRRRIAIIDDNEDAVETMRTLLEMWGHEVVTANDGVSGRDLILRERPDLALVDVGLPGLDGYEVARSVRSAPQSPPTRLVAVTGYGGADAKARAFEAGFDGHVTKPVSIEQLEAIVDEPSRWSA